MFNKKLLNKMKKVIVLACACLLIAGTTVYAQKPQATKQAKKECTAKKCAKRLGLRQSSFKFNQ